VSSGANPFGERAAAHYEAWYETPEGRRADALEKALLGRLLEDLTGDCRSPGHGAPVSVLEVGSGTGHFTRWLAQQGLDAVGLDLSAAMLARAQALGGVSLVQGDACQLPFADGTFDLVAFVTTLEFLGRPADTARPADTVCPQEALVESLRVSRQGLLLGVLNRWSLLGLRRRLAGLLRPSTYSSAHFYRVGELKRLLRSVAGQEAVIEWHTTLLPCGWPRPRSALPWGGFIGMSLSPPPNLAPAEKERGDRYVQYDIGPVGWFEASGGDIMLCERSGPASRRHSDPFAGHRATGVACRS
jgi:SAM-dependent methyltransferase